MLRFALRALHHAEQKRNPVFLSALLRAFSTAGGGEGTIRIDRSGLIQPVEHSHALEDLVHKEPETELVRHLKSLIRVSDAPRCLWAQLFALGFRAAVFTLPVTS